MHEYQIAYIFYFGKNLKKSLGNHQVPDPYTFHSPLGGLNLRKDSLRGHT
jgi:hypothetical protein